MIAVDHGRAPIGNASTGFQAEQITQIRAGLHAPKLGELNFTEHVVFNEDPPEWSLAAFDLATHVVGQVGEIDPHDTELHNNSVRLPREKNLARVVIAHQLTL